MEPSIKIARHPFLLVGYWDGHFKTSEPKDAAIYQSEMLSGLYVVVRLADAQKRFLVRGQWYSSLSVARRVATPASQPR
jgi:hypothetical protein